MSMFPRAHVFPSCFHGLSLGLTLAVLALVVPATVLGVMPPPSGADLPEHIRRAQNEIAAEYGTSGVAARLAAARDPRSGRATAAAATVQVDVPVILGNYADVSHLFSAPDYADLLLSTAPGDRSMTNYFAEVSGGQFDLGGTVYGPFTAAETQAYYVNGDNGAGYDYPTNAGGFIVSVLTAADGTIDFALYDNDGPDGVPNSGDDDGKVDAVVMVFPDGDASGGDGDNIWAHQWNLRSSTGATFVTNDARAGGGFIEVSEYTIQGGEQGNGTWDVIKPVGVFCHEFGHILGLPDLYDTDGSTWGCGTWCLMSLGSWGADWSSSSEDLPVHLSAWCRADLGWADPVTVAEWDSVGMEPGDVVRLWEDAYQGGRFFLVEYRDTVGFDAGLPSEGLLVWHCNEEVFFDNSVDGFRLVDLEEADGQNEIDSRIDFMDQGDMYPWGNTSFTDLTNPSAHDVFGAPTGVEVDGYAMGPGRTIWVEYVPRDLEGYTLYHVGHTWVGGWGYSTAQINYGAVRFAVEVAGDLVAVQAGVFRYTPVDYGVRIFTDMVALQPSGLLATTAGTFPSHASSRYHEIPLPTPLPLAPGDTFLVDCAWGPDDYAVPTLYRRPHSGQSFFSQYGTTYYHWTDKDVALRARIAYPAFVCPVSATGDANADGQIVASDIIYLVNYVLKGGPTPVPCAASGDVTCDGAIVASDIIYLVNYVLKGGPAPCDICPLIEAGTWSCP